MLNFPLLVYFAGLATFANFPNQVSVFPVTVQSVICIVPYCGSQNTTAVVKPHFPIMKQLARLGRGGGGVLIPLQSYSQHFAWITKLQPVFFSGNNYTPG